MKIKNIALIAALTVFSTSAFAFYDVAEAKKLELEEKTLMERVEVMEESLDGIDDIKVQMEKMQKEIDLLRQREMQREEMYKKQIKS